MIVKDKTVLGYTYLDGLIISDSCTLQAKSVQLILPAMTKIKQLQAKQWLQNINIFDILGQLTHLFCHSSTFLWVFHQSIIDIVTFDIRYL